ncbi:hypothetical protein ACIRQQ_22865 [Streptomyces fuscichromogenes]|uniref:hypothetical protein n=1 Tax=Streptomyces fuscichromogenes TaxID=1324013 RepID=UPI003808DD89
MPLHDGAFRDSVDEVGELETAGLDIAHAAEAYSFDAVSRLGYLAARTSVSDWPPGSRRSAPARQPSPSRPKPGWTTCPRAAQHWGSVPRGHK